MAYTLLKTLYLGGAGYDYSRHVVIQLYGQDAYAQAHERWFSDAWAHLV